MCEDDWSDKASEEDSAAGMDEDGESASAAPKPKKQPKAANQASRRKNHLNIVFIGHVG